MAMARVMKPKPDCRSMMPIVKRGRLNNAPSPTVAMISPRSVMIIAFATCPVPAKAAMADRPTTISAKYSAEWNRSATDESAGAKTMSRSAPIVPPAKLATAAIVSALPALPCRAIGYPSKLDATVPATPGAFSRIDEVEPPKIAP